MSDRRVEILNREHIRVVEKQGTSSINTKLFPAAYKDQVLNAMDEYMKECCLELLEYMAKNKVVCGTLSGDLYFHFRDGWITKEQLFENFL